MSTRTEIVPVALPNGTVVQVQATVVSAREDVAFSMPSFDELLEAVEGVASAVTASLEKVRPSKASVELGVEVGLEAGKLTALLVQGTSTANLKITLEWGGS